MRKPASDTVIERYGKAFSYGPRVDSGDEVRPPEGDETPAFWGVYVHSGEWTWVADARDEDSAQRFIQWLLLVP